MKAYGVYHARTGELIRAASLSEFEFYGEYSVKRENPCSLEFCYACSHVLLTSENVVIPYTAENAAHSRVVYIRPVEI